MNEEVKLKLITNLLSAKSTNEGLSKFKDLVYNKFLDFVNKGETSANEAEMILKFQEIEKELELISAYPKLHTKNVIAIGGGFSAGKSEFISSFIKSDIKLPIGLVPTTAIPAYVFNEDKEVLLGCSKDGGIVDLEKIDSNFYTNLSHDFIKSLEFNLKDFMPYIIIGTNIKYENICFIDTPGYNPSDSGFTSEDMKTAREFLDEANILIWLIGADSNGTMPASDLEFLKKINLKEKKLYIVYNKSDLKVKSDIEDVLEVMQEVLEDEGIEFEGISAYSSIMQKELLYLKKSIFQFLEENNVISNRQLKIYEKLKNIYYSYKQAILNARKQKETIYRELHSVSVDILESGDIENVANERIEKLKNLYSTKKEIQTLKKLKIIFDEFKESVDFIFGKKLDFDFDAISYKRLYKLKKEGKYGLVNELGQWVIEPEYDDINNYFDDKGLAQIKKNNRIGYINKKGKIVISPEYDDIYFLDNGYIKVRRDKKYGLLNEKNKIILSLSYDYISNKFKNDLIIVEKNSKYGIINKNEEVIVDFKYDDISFLNNGLIKVEKHDKYGLMNEKYEIILDIKYDRIYSFNNGLAEIEKHGKRGLVNEKGEVIVSPEYDDIDFLGNGLIRLEKNGNYKILNKNKEFIYSNYDSIIDFLDNDLIKVKHNGKYGIINKNEEVIVDFKYDSISFLNNGLIKVKKHDKYGLMNEKYEIIVDIKYDKIYSFNNGLAKIKKHGKYGLINEKGEVIVSPEYDDIDFLGNGLIRLEKNGKYGLINKKGESILDVEYDYIGLNFKNGLAEIEKNGKYGLINEKGEFVLDVEFISISRTDDFIIVGIDEKNQTLISFDGRYLN